MMLSSQTFWEIFRNYFQIYLTHFRILLSDLLHFSLIKDEILLRIFFIFTLLSSWSLLGKKLCFKLLIFSSIISLISSILSFCLWYKSLNATSKSGLHIFSYKMKISKSKYYLGWVSYWIVLISFSKFTRKSFLILSFWLSM